MTPTRSRRGRTPPPVRGRPYRDVGSGVTMILPPEGGKAVPVAERRARKAAETEWSARRALRASGMRAAERGDQAARQAPRAAQAVFGPTQQTAATGGSIALYLIASLVGLIVLYDVLSGRGPAGIAKAVSWVTGGITRLVSPNDPILAKGPAAGASSSSGGSSAAAGTTSSRSSWGAPLTSSPTTLNGVSLTGASLVGVKSGLVDAVTTAAAAGGATIVDVISGRRSDASNAAAGGVQDSNHLTGDAIDGRAYIPGKGWQPLGSLTSFLAKVGVRSGDVAGFFNGHPDPNHVDTGANQ